MIKRISNILIISLLVLLIFPVLITQSIPGEIRHFESVTLEEVVFEEVSFKNEEQDLNLAGMLFIPMGEGPYPAVVIIQGSGTSHRNNSWYLRLSKYLQENGIAVLLPDKRGSVKSEGNWINASFEDLATDTESALTYLRDQNDIQISNLGIIGMSQGGHIAPIVARESTGISFIVNIVGGVVPMYDQLIYEENHNLRQMGILPGVSNVLARVTSYFLRTSGNHKPFWDAVGNYDPLQDWRELNIPSLVMYGQNDTNVPTTESVKRLQSLNKPNIDIRIYEDSGHALEDPVGKGNSIFREDALNDIRDFIYSIKDTT